VEEMPLIDLDDSNLQVYQYLDEEKTVTEERIEGYRSLACLSPRIQMSLIDFLIEVY
jgi:hypothetical protein